MDRMPTLKVALRALRRNRIGIPALKASLRDLRGARTYFFNGWSACKHARQDDLSPAQRRERLRVMASCKRGCLKAARLCAEIEIRILKEQLK